ncbi:hypothetical protein [Rhizorhabdus histidinilytica]|uniref:Uncharacterized protein n=1 Tax=Rhizorhabdus histidinilytica TaxID=439228 RepID=A0A1T5BY17_9SPHN|nr:hypothetical protein [Rhizorhabdus histidinilytica]SKB51893.1 hypothetical protein SAMN06295920_103364 [Rhizorhabdus histidinilytica]
MTQPLNYTKRAWRDLRTIERTAPPLSKLGLRYLAGKLAAAQTIIMPDYGVMYDRGLVRPQMPNTALRPPFPVVALEYQAPSTSGCRVPGYTDSPCSRRIALVWDWKADLPPALAPLSAHLKPGVVVTSIAYMDEMRLWVPATAAGMHIAYDDPWYTPPETVAFERANVAAGRITAEQSAAPRPQAKLVPLMADAMAGIVAQRGPEFLFDITAADIMDEANAHADLCRAIADGAVTMQGGKRGKPIDLRGRANNV